MSKKKDMKIKKNGKVINLTETDLRRIVKKTLSEQTTGSTEGSVGNALSTVKLDNGVEIQQEYIGEYKKVRLNKHQLPIISIIADSMELFDDTLGIYSKGVGVAENWQGIKANYFSKKKIKIDLAYFVNNKLVLSQICKMNVSGGGSRKQPQKSFNI